MPAIRREDAPENTNEDLFPSFQSALRMDPSSAAALKHATRYRLLRGALPASLLWFLRHPVYLRLLADDAERLTHAEWKRLHGLIDERAEAQRQVRERPASPRARKKGAS